MSKELSEIAGQLINELVKKERREHPNLTYRDAMQQVLERHPDLKRNYNGQL